MIANSIEPHQGLAKPVHGAQPADSEAFTMLVTNYFVAEQEALGFGASQWLESRLPLFEKYTLPSVSTGIRKPDVWLLLVSDWVLPLLDPLRASIKPYAYIEILVVEDSGKRDRAIKEWLTNNKQRVGDGPVISARVDNDDAISRDYLHLSHLWLSSVSSRPSPNVALAYPYGLQFAESSRVTYVDMQNNNHFMTIISDNPESFPGLFQNHRLLYSEDRLASLPVREVVTRRPVWLEVVHGANALNSARKAERVMLDSSAYRYRFGISDILS